MAPEDSYLVINNFILPDVGFNLLSAKWDLMMMLVMSGLERTESQWKMLMEAAGLEIEGLYQPLGDGQGVIVANLQWENWIAFWTNAIGPIRRC